MGRRVVELELEAADWLEQLYTADFAVAVFFVGLLGVYGALEVPPFTRRLAGRLQPLRVLQFHLGSVPIGLTYWCAPPGRTIALTVWRAARLREACERERAREALGMCAPHGPKQHELWANLRDRRMREPGAAEMYADTALAFAFGQQVRRRRLCTGRSVHELALAADTTDEVIMRCEAAGVRPSTPVADRIAAALSLNLPFPASAPHQGKGVRRPEAMLTPWVSP
jgi:ribosome-binding protein aMBF1 (putative translation factor)